MYLFYFIFLFLFFFNCHGAVSITSTDLRIKFTSAISPVRQPFPRTSSIRLAPPLPPLPAFPSRPFNFRAPCPSLPPSPLLNPSALIIDIAALRRQARRASPLARVPRARPPKVLSCTTSDDLKAAFFLAGTSRRDRISSFGPTFNSQLRCLRRRDTLAPSGRGLAGGHGFRCTRRPSGSSGPSYRNLDPLALPDS